MAHSRPSLQGRPVSAANGFAKAGIFNFDDQEPSGAALAVSKGIEQRDCQTS
jgi:hypothetical protein